MEDLIKIEVQTQGEAFSSVWAYPGQNLWEVLLANGLMPAGLCGGLGTCGKCKVRVEGSSRPPAEKERFQLLPEEYKKGIRLACHLEVEGPLKITLENEAAAPNLIASFWEIPAFKPLASNRKVYIPGHDRYHPVSIQERLQRAVPDLQFNLGIKNWNDLYLLDRIDRPVLELTAMVLEDQEVIFTGKAPGQLFGLAFDLGTTSLVAALLDLESGATVGTCTMPNMQRVYGADIISRLQYCTAHEEGLQTLHQVVINNLNQMITSLITGMGAHADQIQRLVVVGNPVMLHLFLGLNPQGMAAAPFAGIITDAFSCRAWDLNIMAHHSAEIYLPPQLGGFVGADTTAGLLAIPDGLPEKCLFIDIGTNGEVVLKSGERFWAASAAAGPAFEGSGITSGMRAAAGAIDHFSWENTSGIGWQVLGRQQPRGICGSGLVDLVFFLLERGCIDQQGIFTSRCSENGLLIQEGANGNELVIVPAQKAHQGVPVVLSQEDVRQVQLAKGAIRAAIEILLKESGLSASQLEAVYLAGAFGTYLEPVHAMGIGLLPGVEASLIRNIGDAPVRGAAILLTHPQARRKAASVRSATTLIELADHPDFQDTFLHYLNF